MLGVQEKPSPSKPSRQRHLGQVKEGPPVSLWERPEAEGTDTHGHRRGREEMQRSPGDTPLADAAGVQVAVLGPLCGPTVSYRLVTEAAAEAWGTRALLAHPPAAWTVVTETVDTAAVCREDMVMGKVRRGLGCLGARVQRRGCWDCRNVEDGSQWLRLQGHKIRGRPALGGQAGEMQGGHSLLSVTPF